MAEAQVGIATFDNKYTDRDVREDSSLVTLAYQFLEQYGGSFDFLVDARRRYMENDENLPTPIIRGVLNCMRVDSRWGHRMPAPRWANESGGTVTGAEVIQMKERRGRRPKGPSTREEQCDDTQPHYTHWWGDRNPDRKCKGVEFPINRESKSLPVLRFHKIYARAHTGTLIHTVSTDLSLSSITYNPPRHEYGWGPDYAWLKDTRYAYTFRLDVKLTCRFPSYIQQPILMSFTEAKNAVDLGGVGLKWCKHCFPNGAPAVEPAPF